MITVGLIVVDDAATAVMVNNKVIQATQGKGMTDLVVIPYDISSISYTAELLANSLGVQLHIFELNSRDLGDRWTWGSVLEQITPLMINEANPIDLPVDNERIESRCAM